MKSRLQREQELLSSGLVDSIKGLFQNKYLNVGILFLLIIQLIVFLTPIGSIFGLAKISLLNFIIVFLINIVGFILIELLKPVLTRFIND